MSREPSPFKIKFLLILLTLFLSSCFSQFNIGREAAIQKQQGGMVTISMYRPEKREGAIKWRDEIGTHGVRFVQVNGAPVVTSEQGCFLRSCGAGVLNISTGKHLVDLWFEQYKHGIESRHFLCETIVQNPVAYIIEFPKNSDGDIIFIPEKSKLIEVESGKEVTWRCQKVSTWQ